MARGLETAVAGLLDQRVDSERIDGGYPDIALERTEHRTFDGWLKLVEYTAVRLPPASR